MIKVCSLDFLNKSVFGVDIKNADGLILQRFDDSVTPESILKLYFKDIYTDLPVRPTLKSVDPSLFGMEGADAAGTAVAENSRLFFDEDEAKEVVRYSLIIADILEMDDEKRRELIQAAYYHNVGVIAFTEEDSRKKDFVKKRAVAGYSYMKNQMSLPENIAEVAKLYLDSYDCNRFPLSIREKNNIPYYNIVAIASFYHRYLQETGSKEEAMKKMLCQGGNKFNIYILHKFISKVRMQND